MHKARLAKMQIIHIALDKCHLRKKKIHTIVTIAGLPSLKIKGLNKTYSVIQFLTNGS